MARKVLTESFSAPLDGATSARIDIHAGDGNLTIDSLAGSEQALASGLLEYLEKQGPPTRILDANGGRATLRLKAGRGAQPWFRLPWAACNGATQWQVHIHPAVSSDLTAHSDGGNVRLDLAGLAVTRVSADTGGGNVEVVLPDSPADVSVLAKTGAGNVRVLVPSGMAARIHATSGLGTVIVDPRFSQTGKGTYQSPDYEDAADRVELTAHSGAGNVSVKTE